MCASNRVKQVPPGERDLDSAYHVNQGIYLPLKDPDHQVEIWSVRYMEALAFASAAGLANRVVGRLAPPSSFPVFC